MDQNNNKPVRVSGISRWITIFAIAVMGLWCCILAGASLAGQLSPDKAGDYYSSAWVWATAVVINVLMMGAILYKPRVRWDTAGMWAAHIGVVMLTAGSFIYAWSLQKGYCVSQKIDGQWSSISSFYTDRDAEVKLPKTMNIIKADREIYPASNVVKDNICIVRIGTSQEVLSFNNPVDVGKYRITQGHWQMNMGAPELITFQVSTRRGIPLIWCSFALITVGLLHAFYIKPIIRSKRKFNSPAAVLLLLAGVMVLAPGCKRSQDDPLFDKPTNEFLNQVDDALLDKAAVQYDGRICPLDTLARRQLGLMTSRNYKPQSPAKAYLELYFNAGGYLHQPLIAIRSKKLQRFIDSRESLARAEEVGHIPPMMLVTDEALEELFSSRRLGRDDLVRADDIPSLENIWKDADSDASLRPMLKRLTIRYSAYIASGVLRLVPDEQQWTDTSDLLKQRTGPHPTIVNLQQAWRAKDAPTVNKCLSELIQLQSDYQTSNTRVELTYNRIPRGGIILGGFAAAGLLGVLGLCGFKKMSLAGMLIFYLATLFSLAMFICRWVISHRGWYFPPLASQYEAMVGSVLLVAVASVLVEKLKPRGIISAAACLYAVVVMATLGFMGRLFPSVADSSLGAVSGILSSKIMSLHVAVIVIGHGFVAMTMLLSLIYLVWVFISPPVAETLDDEGGLAGLGRANMVLIKLSCVCIIVGTMLGAYWADFAWSRWWGWDAKETWALITAVLYVMIIHLRFVVDKRWAGTACAIGCLIGGSAMLFNWFIVNWVFVGLHSYS